MAEKTVFMIGHSNLTWPEFTKLIGRHQIEVLADVRTFARSRLDHFNGGHLSRALNGTYRHHGELGGFKQFEAPAVRRSLQDLLQSVRGKRLCLMCSEGDFRNCHRHTQLTPLLIALEWRVLQIQRDGTLVEDHGPQPRLF
jgi:uncharacterized protein (DUF488 family)